MRTTLYFKKLLLYATLLCQQLTNCMSKLLKMCFQRRVDPFYLHYYERCRIAFTIGTMQCVFK